MVPCSGLLDCSARCEPIAGGSAGLLRAQAQWARAQTCQTRALIARAAHLRDLIGDNPRSAVDLALVYAKPHRQTQ